MHCLKLSEYDYKLNLEVIEKIEVCRLSWLEKGVKFWQMRVPRLVVAYEHRTLTNFIYIVY